MTGTSDPVCIRGGQPTGELCFKCGRSFLFLHIRLAQRGESNGMDKAQSRTVLVIDDDPSFHDIVDHMLVNQGYAVLCIADPSELEWDGDAISPSVILLDWQLDHCDGTSLIQPLRRHFPLSPVIFVTAYSSPEVAATAIKMGAFDFLTKPLDESRLLIAVAKAVEQHRLLARLHSYEEVAGDGFEGMIGTSAQMQTVYSVIRNVAPTDVNVMISGESGTGKELVALAIHRRSRRHAGPFVALNVASIPEELAEATLFGHEKGAYTGADRQRAGAVREAAGGTLFLDEITEMPMSLQSKLLRFLQEGTYRPVGADQEMQADTRIVSATNRVPAAAVSEQRLREDLYYRLNVVPIQLPPLRERDGDLPLLVRHALRTLSEKHGKHFRDVDENAWKVLLQYTWPGNVRQLLHVIERAIVMHHGEIIEPHMLPLEIARAERSSLSSRMPRARSDYKPLPTPCHGGAVPPVSGPVSDIGGASNGRAPSPLRRVLIADNDPRSLRVLNHYLSVAGYETVTAEDGRQALSHMSSEIGVAVLDADLPELSGRDCLQHVRQQYPGTQVILMSGGRDCREPSENGGAGVFAHLFKPLDRETLVAYVSQARAATTLARRYQDQDRSARTSALAEDFVARAAATRQLLDRAARIAGLDRPVLITGEPGSGKSLLARIIHQSGHRSAGPLVTVDCRAIPPELLEAELFGSIAQSSGLDNGGRSGCAELADGGTLFLDEIDHLPQELQLRVLPFFRQRTVLHPGLRRLHSVDVQIITASHRDLAGMCREQRFCCELYRELSLLTLHVPPLRERSQDIAGLAERILARTRPPQLGRPLTCCEAAMSVLQSYDWPGNVRELEAVLLRAATFCESETVEVADLMLPSELFPASMPSPEEASRTLAGHTLDELEQMAIRETLDVTQGNKAEAARRLGISEKSIYNKMKRFGIRG